jgi:hypothetical protein
LAYVFHFPHRGPDKQGDLGGLSEAIHKAPRMAGAASNRLSNPWVARLETSRVPQAQETRD